MAWPKGIHCGQHASLPPARWRDTRGSDGFREGLYDILISTQDALFQIGVAVLCDLRDLPVTEAEDEAVFVVVAPSALCLHITAHFCDDQIALGDQVDGPCGVLAGERREEGAEKVLADR